MCKIIKEMERKQLPSVNLSRTVYHGSASFTENMDNKLLKLSPNLSKFCEQELDLQTAAKAPPFLTALSQFDLIVDACLAST